jgi:hypothetical protein
VVTTRKIAAVIGASLLFGYILLPSILCFQTTNKVYAQGANFSNKGGDYNKPVGGATSGGSQGYFKELTNDAFLRGGRSW